MPDRQPSPHEDSLPIAISGSGRVDLAPRGIVARRLAVYEDRLARVQARGGDYALVRFSPYVSDLLARLEAGAHLAKRVH